MRRFILVLRPRHNAYSGRSILRRAEAREASRLNVCEPSATKAQPKSDWEFAPHTTWAHLRSATALLVGRIHSVSSLLAPCIQSKLDPQNTHYGAVAALTVGLLGLALKASAISPQALHAAQSGINLIYAMDFDAAQREFNAIQSLEPEQPFAYYGPAAASFVRFEYGSQRSDPALAADFESKVEISIQKAESWLKKNPKDALALLAMGGSYGLRTRFWVMQRHWFKAVLDGRRAIKATREARDRDPQLADAYLGIGMWEYYADVFPRLMKSLGRLLLGGDRVQGFKHLQVAAEQGHFVAVAAKLILIEISLEDQFGYRDPKRGLTIIQELRRQFPDSPIFHQIEQVCLFESGDYEGARKTTDEYVRRIESGRPFYLREELPRMHVVYGTIYMARKQWAEADTEFDMAAAMAGDKAKPNRWALWGTLREGEVEDALGRRSSAIKLYHRVLAYPDIFGFYPYAKNRISHPYTVGAAIGAVAPPA